jgi:hypothetical protein
MRWTCAEHGRNWYRKESVVPDQEEMEIGEVEHSWGDEMS